jgi:uncharacterized protein
MGSSVTRRLFAIAALLCAFLAPAAAVPGPLRLAQSSEIIVPATSEFPALSGRVVDDAGLLDAAARESLRLRLAAHEATRTNQIVVATVRSLNGNSIEDYANRLFRRWQLGQRGKNNGVLLLHAPTERKIRIEVGYGLEGTLTDAITRYIIQSAITPRFKANDFAGGMTRGVDDIIKVLNGDEEISRRANPPPSFAFEAFHAVVPFGLIVLPAALLVIALKLTGFMRPMHGVKSGRKRRRTWRGSDDRSSSDSSSDSSSYSSSSSSWGSSSSSSSDSFSGGGGDSGGGGSSGDY